MPPILCSGLVSKETPLLEESSPSQKLNKNKRSGSPSPLSANKAIMKCGVSGNMLIEISMECPKISQKGSEDVSNTGNGALAMSLPELEGFPVGGLAGTCKAVDNRQNDGNGQLVAQHMSADCRDSLDVNAECSASQSMQNSEFYMPE